MRLDKAHTLILQTDAVTRNLMPEDHTKRVQILSAVDSVPVARTKGVLGNLTRWTLLRGRIINADACLDFFAQAYTALFWNRCDGAIPPRPPDRARFKTVSTTRIRWKNGPLYFSVIAAARGTDPFFARAILSSASA